MRATSAVSSAVALRVNPRLFYGWVMVAVGALSLVASGPGQSFTFSVFVGPLSEALGLSSSWISGAYGAGTLIAAFLLPAVGRLVDRWGVRSVMLLAALLLGLSALLFSRVTGVVVLFVGFTLLRFFGQGSLMLVSDNLVAQWFSRRRGFALSMAGLGFGASLAVYPPLAQWLIDLTDWRQAWVLLGVITWVTLIPLALLLVVNRPEDVGLQPDGRAGGGEASTDAGGSQGGSGDQGVALKDRPDVGLSLSEALREPAFYIMALGLAVAPMLVTGMVFHQVSYFELQGLAAQTAASIFTITAVSMVVIMPLWGHLFDRVPTRFMVSAGLLVMAAAMVAMLWAVTPLTAALYAVIFGGAHAAMLTGTQYVWPDYFGRKHLGSIQGVSKTVMVCGASLGPLPFGIAYDVLGSYRLALLLLLVLPLGFAVLAMLARSPLQKKLEREGAPAGA